MADEKKEGGVEVGMTTLFRQRGAYGPRRGACGWVLRSKGEVVRSGGESRGLVG